MHLADLMHGLRSCFVSFFSFHVHNSVQNAEAKCQIYIKTIVGSLVILEYSVSMVICVALLLKGWITVE